MSKRNGINIELTPTQYDYLYEVIMMAYELDVPEQKGWDLQTYDNMVDNVCNGKSTILSNDVKGIMPIKLPSQPLLHFCSGCFIIKEYRNLIFMSTLHHEDLLLQIFDEVQEAFPYLDEEKQIEIANNRFQEMCI